MKSKRKKRLAVGQIWTARSTTLGEVEKDGYWAFQLVALIEYGHRRRWLGVKVGVDPDGTQLAFFDDYGKGIDDVVNNGWYLTRKLYRKTFDHYEQVGAAMWRFTSEWF